MILVVSVAAAEQLELARPSQKDLVPALKYSFSPQVEQKYHYSGRAVTSSFESSNTSDGSTWSLVWYRKEKLPKEIIHKSAYGELAIVYNIRSHVRSATVDFENGEFQVAFSN